MTTSTGNIDILKEIVDLWYELVKTQSILQRVVNKGNSGATLGAILSEKELKECEEIALKTVQNRFPQLGIRPR